MKFCFFISAFLITVLFSGCAATVVGKDGNTYKALSKSQIERLVLISRASLKESYHKNIITKEEYFDAMHDEPQVIIDYRGDRFGLAKIIWFTRGRKLEFSYEDDLTEEIIRKCSFATSYIQEKDRRIQPDKSIRGH